MLFPFRDRLYSTQNAWPSYQVDHFDLVAEQWDSCLETAEQNRRSSSTECLEKALKDSRASRPADDFCRALMQVKNRQVWNERGPRNFKFAHRSSWLWLPSECIDTPGSKENRLKSFARVNSLFVVIYGDEGLIELTNIWDRRFEFFKMDELMNDEGLDPRSPLQEVDRIAEMLN